MENNGTGSAMPVKASERYMILDILRGFALMGIAVANFPEFALYTFLPGEAVAAMPTAKADCVARWVQYMLIDGKFYTIFSLLFGIGFSIIISNAMCRGADGLKIFYRRMAILAAIGLLHLMLLWSGDILLLYALMGMLLPLFRNATDRIILSWAVAMLLLPVAVDTAAQLAGIYLSAPVVEMQQHCCSLYGITDANFAYWLRDAADYHAVHQFLVQGALVRVQEFIDGNRYFKVLGLFLIGYCIGRHRLSAAFGCRMPCRRAAIVGDICMECRRRPPVGQCLSFGFVCAERLSYWNGIRSYVVPHLSASARLHRFQDVCRPGTHGSHVLYRAIGCGDTHFLWHRIGAWRKHGLGAGDCRRSGHFRGSSIAVCCVVAMVSFRAA